MISLDNINFYHHPPASKPPAHTSFSSGWNWKSYHVPSAPQSLSFSRPLPPKPPTAVTAVLTSTIKDHFQCAAPRNIFDLKLEKVPTREDSPALQDQLGICPQPRGNTVCSGLIVTITEADSGYSDRQSVNTVDNNLLDDSDCQLSLSGREVEKQTTITDSILKHPNSQLPSPALSNPTSPGNKSRAPPGQQYKVMFKDLLFKAACCGEQTRALTPELATTS
ncbi:hypothetical protein ASPCADRAFT_400786 [Aspergillus carbonarius ITEM 5010]|uniref:Uncharacterized protein n=1 Tax=Aspergillus carbonarius (strain ITEM 5010) TaxID=602072 RepID=A0A1R3R7P3_ASPC5|nr:hypothetical protein ASPCADRAFT_400786 [Aspergillus carbonarius ITEM 5010]